MVEGNVVNLHCNSTALPEANVTWKKLEEPQKNFPTGAKLTLNATRDDTGSYQCVADNGVGSNKSSHIAFLVVHCEYKI